MARFRLALTRFILFLRSLLDSLPPLAAATGAAAEEAEAWLPGSGGGFLVMLYFGGGFKEAEVTSEAAPATATAGPEEVEDEWSPGTCPGATWRWEASAASPDVGMDGSFLFSLAFELLIFAALAPLLLLLVTGFSCLSSSSLLAFIGATTFTISWLLFTFKGGFPFAD